MIKLCRRSVDLFPPFFPSSPFLICVSFAKSCWQRSLCVDTLAGKKFGKLFPEYLSMYEPNWWTRLSKIYIELAVVSGRRICKRVSWKKLVVARIPNRNRRNYQSCVITDHLGPVLDSKRQDFTTFCKLSERKGGN